MADKNFKVKSGLNIPITSAAILTTDVDGNISSSATLPVANGGTGQTSANNALNALLPIQNGSTINYALESDGVNTSWQKLYNQTIKNNGTTVTPRGIVNIVGGTFTDDSGSDTTTLTIPTNYVSLNGGSTITASTASTKGLIIKGAASQTANLTEWQNSAGTVLTSISSGGNLVVGATGTLISYASGRGIFALGDPASVGLTVKAAASQTANLQQWQDSGGNVLTRVQADGTISWGTGGSALQNSSGRLIVNPSSASAIAVIVKGAASQTANLQEWQNSAGTLLASISSAGSAWFKIGARVSGNYGGSQALLVQNDQNIIGLTIKANTTQTANLTEWQDSAGAVKGYINPNGDASFGSISAGYYTPYSGAFSANALLYVNTNATGNRGIVVDGWPSQTADLQQWRNFDGTVLASLSASGNLMVQNLTVNGTTTTINSTTLTVDDKNIELASVSSPTDTTADGAGITIKGATDKTFNWVQSTAAFTSSEPISAPAFKSAGTAVSSNITLVSGYRYFVDTTSARTLTLPSMPSVGDEIQIYDASNNALTNNITIQPNGNKINGVVDTLLIDSNSATVYLTYTGSSYGWVVN